MLLTALRRPLTFLLALALSGAASMALATDKALLDILLENGLISQPQYDQLLEKEQFTSAELLSSVTVSEPMDSDEEELAAASALDENVQLAIDDAVASAMASESPVVASYGSKGFRLETRDGNWQTNLQWRAQFRYSNPYGSDPRQISSYENASGSSFEQRRLRMKIGPFTTKKLISTTTKLSMQ